MYNCCSIYNPPGGTSGAVTGSGTLNYVAKWTPNGTTLGNSLFFDNGTNVLLSNAAGAPAHFYDVVKSQDDVTTINILNNNAGTSASTRYRLSGGASTTVLQHFGTGYTTSSYNIQNGGLLINTGNGGLNFVTTNASATIGVWTNSLQRAIFTNDGGLGMGLTTLAAKLDIKEVAADPWTYVARFGSDQSAATANIFSVSYSGTSEAVGILRAKEGSATFQGGTCFEVSSENPTFIARFGSTTVTNALTVNFQGEVGLGTAAVADCALLEMVSTTRGFLPPRMTTTQRDAIGTLTAGLIIYNTTTNKLNVYTTAWEQVTSA